jgi:hypothetical protein
MEVMTGTNDVDALRASSRGPVFASDDQGYDGARYVWNAIIDRRPGSAVRASSGALVSARYMYSFGVAFGPVST